MDNLSDLARLFEGIEDIRRHESTFGGMLQPFLSTLHELKTRMGVEYDVEEEFDRVNEVKQQVCLCSVTMYAAFDLISRFFLPAVVKDDITREEFDASSVR